MVLEIVITRAAVSLVSKADPELPPRLSASAVQKVGPTVCAALALQVLLTQASVGDPLWKAHSFLPIVLTTGKEQ